MNKKILYPSFWQFWRDEFADRHVYTLPFLLGTMLAYGVATTESEKTSAILWALIGLPTLNLFLLLVVFFAWRMKRKQILKSMTSLWNTTS